MSFKNKDLSVIAYANGFTLWHYNTTDNDSIETVLSKGYFNPVKTLMNTGDMMYINTPDATTQVAITINDRDVILHKMCIVEHPTIKKSED